MWIQNLDINRKCHNRTGTVFKTNIENQIAKKAINFY